MRFAFALLALLLAGCAQPAPSPVASSPLPEPGASAFHPSWNMTGCRELTASFDVDSSALQAKLPPGFAPGSGMTPGKTTVGIDAFSCKDGPYASFWALATPPGALQGDVKSWYVKWDVLLADNATLSALAPLRTSVHPGQVRFTDAGPEGVGSACEIALEGVGTMRITIGPYALTPSSGAARLREFTTTGDARSILAWDATLGNSARGVTTGVAEVPGGSVAASLYGSTRIPVTIQMASSALTNATIRLLPLSPG